MYKFINEYFCPLSSFIFSFQFSPHFGEKTFWWVRGENTEALQFIFFSPTQPNTLQKSLNSYFLFKVFHPPYFTSKQKHPVSILLLFSTIYESHVSHYLFYLTFAYCSYYLWVTCESLLILFNFFFILFASVMWVIYLFYLTFTFYLYI